MKLAFLKKQKFFMLLTFFTSFCLLQKVPEDDGTKQREAWMLELPPESTVILGLGPRTFRAKEGPDMSNRSEWTDTPTEKAEKQRMLMVSSLNLKLIQIHFACSTRWFFLVSFHFCVYKNCYVTSDQCQSSHSVFLW